MFFRPVSFVLPAGLICAFSRPHLCFQPASLCFQPVLFRRFPDLPIVAAQGKSGLVPSERVPTPSLPRLRRVPLVCAGAHASRSLPLSAAIDLHEIHLARQSSLQVAVGHITVPGGIKLCSPGTFLVANYLIINNGPSQVNFTKPKRATIRYTNSQWLREDATETSVGRGAVPKTG